MNLQVITPPAMEPVRLSDAKAYLRISHDAEDTLITDLIACTRGQLEATLSLSLVTQRFLERLDDWSANNRLREDCFLLAKSTVTAIHNLRIYDHDGAPRLLDLDQYQLDPASAPSRLIALRGSRFPVPGRRRNGIEIEFSAGFGATPEAVPETLRIAILQMVADRFEHREADTEFIPHATRALIAPYLKVRL